MTELRRDPWWKADKDEAHARVFDAFRAIDESQQHHRQRNLHHLRLYSNRLATALTGRDFALPAMGERLRLNVCRAVIDAATAQMATKRPRPFYLVEKGDFHARRRAKGLGKFVMGQFYGLDQYNLSLQLFRDAGILGTAAEKFYSHGGRIFSERVWADELVCDDNESKYGAPRQLFQYKSASREVVAETWRSSVKKIDEKIASAELVRDEGGINESVADLCSVIEAWHLPSGPDAKDGRHVVAVSNATIVDESWTRDRFPFAVWRWAEAPIGFWGVGIAEEIASIQVEINYVLSRIQEMANQLTTSIWLPKGSGVGKVSNRVAGVYTYTGNQPPTNLQLGGIPQELLVHVDNLYRKAFEMEGVSQMAAQSIKPAGLNSGEALKTYHDIGAQRFQHVGQRWETFHVRGVAECILDEARDIAEEGRGAMRVLSQGDRDVEVVDFRQVSVERDKYTVKAWPTSLLPDSPEGKLDTIEKLSQINPDIQRYSMQLLDVPDLDGIRSLITAPIEIVDMQLELMIENEEPQTPTPQIDVDMARNRATLTLLRGTIDKVPEKRLDLVRNYLSQLDALQAAAEAKQQPPSPAPTALGQPVMPQQIPQPIPGQAPAPGPMAGVTPLG